jgi:hypothetical protein
VQDFGDGGAFPEIPVAQYPLNMGREGKESTSNALAVQLDAQGKIKYDVLARQGHAKDKVMHLFHILDQTELTKLNVGSKINLSVNQAQQIRAVFAR